MNDAFEGWHFLPADRRLARGDGREVGLGEPIAVGGPPSVGCRGLHASSDILEALEYAPGPILCRVRLTGEIDARGTLAAATERTVLAWADATELLHEFACRCAEDVIHLCDRPEVARAAIDAKRRWLRGEAADEELSAAGDAWYAAWSAAVPAAGSAAVAAAGSAAGDAWYAAWAAARAAQRERLEGMAAGPPAEDA